MALTGDTDFRMQPDVNLASIASLYQKKATDEQQMQLQQSEIQSQQQDRVMNVMKMATNLTQGLIQSSAQMQMNAGRKNLQALLSQQDQPTPSDQMTPAQSSVLPQLSQAPISVPQGQTPGFQDQVRASLMQANPQAATDEMAKRAFNPPVTKPIIKTVMQPDGTPGYMAINPQTGEETPLSGLTAPGLTKQQRQEQITNQGRSASARESMAGTMAGKTELSTIQSGPGAVEQNKVQQAVHTKSLVDQYTDHKTGDINLPTTLYPELALSLARLTSANGVVGVELEKQLMQVTTRGQLARLYVRFTGDTSKSLANASTQDVLKLYRDSIDRQGQVAEENRNTQYKLGQRLLGKKEDTSGLIHYESHSSEMSLEDKKAALRKKLGL